MSQLQEFAYHRAVSPMMWALFALSLIELFAVHFFVALKWPWIGWPLTIISALGAVWILFWIRSFKVRPHRLDADTLELNLGNMKSVRVDLANIARVSSSLEQGALETKSLLNLAGIAYPNRTIELLEPIRGKTARVGIRLDDTEHFDKALRERNIAFS